LLGEPGADAVDAAIGDGIVSSVNIAEVIERIARADTIRVAERIVATLPCLVVPPDIAVATDAGALRAITRFAGLSLGDRFCLALARSLSAPVLTAGRNWTRIAATVGVEVRLIR